MTLSKAPADSFETLTVPKGGAALRWLGMAGFLLQTERHRIVIDPYLSDSLAEKYEGKKFPHTRMMPIPVEPHALTGIDWVFCTHGHTDHMDPGSLPGLLGANPNARVLVPRSELAKALERGVPKDRLQAIDAGDVLDLGDGLTVIATPAAHEALARDLDGHYLYLGYVIVSGGVRVWHSGDTIPFDGFADILSAMSIDVALLPINGRDETRAQNGVPGNLTVDEAIELCARIGVRAGVFHHFGMFDFNTVAPDLAQSRIDQAGSDIDFHLSDLDTEWRIGPAPKKKIRVLAVCRGNICRSPTAEAVLRHYLGDQFEVDSAALMDWNVGRAPHAQTAEIAAKRGFDLRRQRARQVTEEDFRTYDVILGMDAANMAGLDALRPTGGSARLAHLGAFGAFGKIVDIPDPYGFEDDVFEQVFDQIDAAAMNFAIWAG